MPKQNWSIVLMAKLFNVVTMRYWNSVNDILYFVNNIVDNVVLNIISKYCKQ